MFDAKLTNILHLIGVPDISHGSNTTFSGSFPLFAACIETRMRMEAVRLWVNKHETERYSWKRFVS